MSLFTRLFDDAALFSPSCAPMDEALPAYRAAAAAPDPVVGRFLCPASRIAELRTHLVPEDLLDLGLIADTDLADLPKALDAVRSEPRVRLVAVEIALPEDADQARAAAVTIARLPSDVPTYIEVRRAPGWRDILGRLAAARARGAPLGAKLRTGGLVGEAFPSTAELAAFIAACAERDVPFKCTAGLHHAVRHTDPATGIRHHGFLNLLLAVSRAATPAYDHFMQPLERTLQQILDRTDVTAMTTDANSTPGETTRRLLTSIGSCDINSPRADLTRLGLVGLGDLGKIGPHDDGFVG
ncbi:hypothetical protein [Actinomadura rudentiformis]|uniref:HpcH/HpaI aldolase/citrate lyase domain-containing protein n=1 Tax=Actinomadura rudentiformis TaxID=359158 RepID=A0A6H9Z3M2_9ACTN|nr:hypothetical protein [Actinomadura rudentiformis]KAB2347950.1 hypothetical protein F8566_18900 [Actinomadura rudentiformis]